jgi:carboxymethylenebutenolidase
MRRRLVMNSAALVLLLAGALLVATEPTPASESDTSVHPGHRMSPARSRLPTAATAGDVLNATGRHGEWLRITTGSTTLLTFAVYPDRVDKAPVVIISERDRPMNDRMRAIADQVASEGFIALAPDSLPGVSDEARIEAVRNHAVAMAPANGAIATLTFSNRITAAAGGVTAMFGLDQQAWTDALGFLNSRTNNHPTLVNLPPHDHGLVDLGVIAQAEAPAQAQGGGRGGERPCQVGAMDCKHPDFLAGFNTASSTLARSPRRSEWVDIDVDGVKVHTNIIYPTGTGRFPIVIAMQHANGLNDWMRAMADQLAREGFVVLAPDMHSGLGPNGGNFDSFKFPDDVVRANSRLNAEMVMRRYKAVREYGLKLPEANGKSASIGFCGGGTRSFEMATQVPQLNAAVVYYGAAPAESQLANINAPVLALYGAIDTRIMSTVPATVDAMKRLGKRFETHVYEGATHSFLIYQNIGENTAATTHAWPRTVAFLKEHTE